MLTTPPDFDEAVLLILLCNDLAVFSVILKEKILANFLPFPKYFKVDFAAHGEMFEEKITEFENLLRLVFQFC